MAYQVSNESKPKMTQLIASNGIKQLATDLQLSQEQIQKANSTALRLSTDYTLRNCDPASLLKYCYEVARYNFSREDCCYPVPYGNSIQTQISYKGYREIAMRSGKYKTINASEVYDCDKIIRDRETGEIIVQFNEDFNATIGAKVVGYYAYAKRLNNEISDSVFMTKEQVEGHGKEFSKSYNNVWAKQFDKMAKKTVIKQLCNQIDQTPELQEVIKRDQMVLTKDGEGYLDNPLNRKPLKKDETPIVAELEPETTPIDIDKNGVVQEKSNKSNISPEEQEMDEIWGDLEELK